MRYKSLVLKTQSANAKPSVEGMKPHPYFTIQVPAAHCIYACSLAAHMYYNVTWNVGEVMVLLGNSKMAKFKMPHTPHMGTWLVHD